ncbi:hypothetical protein BJX64DRAFT_286894 [Aspergillus heterothallicus]
MIALSKITHAVSTRAHVCFLIGANKLTGRPSRSAYDLGSLSFQSVRNEYPGNNKVSSKHGETTPASAHVHLAIESNNVNAKPPYSAYDRSASGFQSVRNEYPSKRQLPSSDEEAISDKTHHVHFSTGTNGFPTPPSCSAYDLSSFNRKSVRCEYPARHWVRYRVDGLEYKVTIEGDKKKWYKF